MAEAPCKSALAEGLPSLIESNEAFDLFNVSDHVCHRGFGMSLVKQQTELHLIPTTNCSIMKMFGHGATKDSV